MKIINQQLFGRIQHNDTLKNKVSVPWYICGKKSRDTVSFSGNVPNCDIPKTLSEIDIKNTNSDEKLETTKNSMGKKIITKSKIKTMEVNHKNLDVPVELTTVEEDADGNRLNGEIIKRSKEDPFECDIFSYTPDAQFKQLSQTIRTPNGTMTTQDIISSDNLFTVSKIQKRENNRSELKYKIYSKFNESDEFTRTFEKIDENHTKSTYNGNCYETEFLPDKIVSKTFDNIFNKEKTVELDYDQLDPALIDLYKQLPGDYFFKLKKLGTKVRLNYEAEQNNACYNVGNNTLSVSEGLKNNPYAFAHELGHAMDYNVIQFYTWRGVNDQFRNELNNFELNATDSEKEAIKYFTKRENGLQNCLAEIAAETLALTSGLKNNSEVYMLRGIILQKYFPNTIKEISDVQVSKDKFI